MTLSLRTRLGLGYAVAIAGLVVVVLLSVFAFNVAREQTAQVHDSNIPSIDAARDLMLQLERMENAEFLYFAPGQDVTKRLRQFDEAAATFERRFLEAEASAQSPQERQFYQAIGTHYGAYRHFS